MTQESPDGQSFVEPGLHAAPLHASPTVHGLSSLQGIAFGTFVHPAAASQESSVQGFLSSQTTGPPTQAPLTQASPAVQALWSEHGPVHVEPPHESMQSPGLQVGWHATASFETNASPAVSIGVVAALSSVVSANPASASVAWTTSPAGRLLVHTLPMHFKSPAQSEDLTQPSPTPETFAAVGSASGSAQATSVASASITETMVWRYMASSGQVWTKSLAFFGQRTMKVKAAVSPRRGCARSGTPARVCRWRRAVHDRPCGCSVASLRRSRGHKLAESL